MSYNYSVTGNYANMQTGSGINAINYNVPSDQQNLFANSDTNITDSFDAPQENASNVPSGYTAVEKNKGFFTKIKSFFTGKDYYKTSTGVKISTEKRSGQVYENANGEVYAEGLEKAKIKGTKNNDNIMVNSSTIKKIKGKRGDDNITIANSKVNKVFGNAGEDHISIINSYAKKIKGKGGKDTIIGKNSNIKHIRGGGGKDVIYTEGGYTKKVHASPIDEITINNNPLNKNPDENWSFEA